jgi:hypothetical protein
MVLTHRVALGVSFELKKTHWGGGGLWQVRALQATGGVRMVPRAWVDERLDAPTTPLTDDAFAVPPRESAAVQQVLKA